MLGLNPLCKTTFLTSTRLEPEDIKWTITHRIDCFVLMPGYLNLYAPTRDKDASRQLSTY
jgi:hypothetical protein